MKKILGAPATAKLTGTAREVLETKGSDVHVIGRTASVYDAVAKMSVLEIGALFVMDGSALAGVVSERDYARKVILQGRASKDTRVEEIMTSPVLSVTPGTPLTECMRVMSERHIRHLPVQDGERVVGVISIGDLISAILEQQAQTIEQLNAVISGPYPA